MKRISILILLCTALNNPAAASDAWNEYKTAKVHNAPLPLPDFSFSGYKNGEVVPDTNDWPILQIKDFGAIPDDGKSDLQALTAATNEAKELSSAIIQFEAGQYDLSQTSGITENLINIVGKNILLRGMPADDLSSLTTVFFFEKKLETRTPQKRHSTPYMLRIGDRAKGANPEIVTHVHSSAKMGEFSIEVADTSRLKKGDIIALSLNDKHAVEENYLFAPYSIEPAMKKVRTGTYAREFHRIEKIDDNRLTFEAPVMSDIIAHYNWDVEKLSWNQNIGIENIAFKGNFSEVFVHHKNAEHNSGWSAIKVSNVYDAWVKNVSFTAFNQNVDVHEAANVTVENAVITGNRAHFGFQSANSSRVLFKYVEDQTEGMQHPMSVINRTNSIVFFCAKWPKSTGFDFHGAFPTATLHDNSKGGFSNAPNGGISGASQNYPNHMAHLVIWNFHHLGASYERLQWWHPLRARWKFIMPSLIGWYGGLPDFPREQMNYFESFGKRVEEIPSLYLAQLELRLGKLPDFVENDPKRCF